MFRAKVAGSLPLCALTAIVLPNFSQKSDGAVDMPNKVPNQPTQSLSLSLKSNRPRYDKVNISIDCMADRALLGIGGIRGDGLSLRHALRLF